MPMMADKLPKPDETTHLQQAHGSDDDDKKSAASLYDKLLKSFGWKFLVFLTCSQQVTKGFTMSFTGAAEKFVLQAYNVKASRMGIYNGVIHLPWALKPAIGVLSDTCPIAGYSKLPYMFLATTLGVASLATLGSVRDGLGLQHVVALMFIVEIYGSTTDLLSEAIYARVLRRKPSEGPGLLSFVWGGLTIGGLFASVGAGIMLSQGSPFNLYLVAVIPASIIIVPIFLNWMGDVKMSDEEGRQQRDIIWKQSEAVMLAVVMLCCTLLLTWSGMNLTTTQNGIVSIIVALVILTVFSVLLNPIIAKVNALALIQTSIGVSAGGASFYFAMDTPEQYPEGPHFSVMFYSTIIPVVGCMCSLLGIYFYNQHASSWTYQKMYIVGNIACSVVACSDLIFYLRLNKQWGVNDHVFVLGSSALQSVLYQWLWMPGVVLLAQLCPKGMEAIMYANLAGCHNIGYTIAANLGACLLEMLHVNPSGENNESEQFNSLWIVAALATVLPLLPVILVPWLIPNKLQTEKIFEREDTTASEGSLWQRWTGASIADDPT